MSAMKIKKGDTVKVIAGKDKDKEGKVLAVNAKSNTVIVEGITENCIATVDDVNIVLTVVGKEEKLADLSGEEFYFVADVSGLKPGEHRVELVCRHSGTFSDLEYVPREITVNIEEIQDEEPEEDSSEEE